MTETAQRTTAIYLEAQLIERAVRRHDIILICEDRIEAAAMTELGIPAAATVSGEWSVNDCHLRLPAWQGLRLCLYSNNAEWIHSTAGALAQSGMGSPLFVAEVNDNADLTVIYKKINNPLSDLLSYDWDAEAVARLYRLPPPFDLTREISGIPRTDYIYGTHYIRREVSITVAPAGAGKSFLSMTEALAMASGRNLLGQPVAKPCRVWYCSEDHKDDAELRLRAAMDAHKVTAAEIGDRIHLRSFRDDKLKLATIEKGQVKIKEKLVEGIMAEARDKGVDVIIFDTLKKIHNVNENSNPEMDTLMDELIYIAEHGQCAVELVHHMGKPGDRSQNMNSLRGASSIIGAARAGRFLCRITKEEGEKAGVDNHKSFFSVEGGKFNKSAEDMMRRWFKLSGRDMANGENVGQLFRWHWPDAFSGMSESDTVAILEKLSEQPTRADEQSLDWAGHIVAEHLSLTVGPKPDKNDKERVRARSRVKSILKTWETNEQLKRKILKDRRGKDRPFFVTTGKHRS